jgi:Ca2+-binding EF-hand superfamily protein
MVLPMDRDARRQKLSQVFSQLDANADGRIDRAEFGELLAMLGASLSPAEADAAFADIDHNGNGSIDVDELALWWKFPFH